MLNQGREGKIKSTICGILLGLFGSVHADNLNKNWSREWPNTDFSQHSVKLSEIQSGGPGKDGIPAIDHPHFAPISGYLDGEDREPVIALTINGDARAYPLSVLIWHEIVNDEVGGIPVAVTYCPLCNTSIVFDRRVGGTVLNFGTTGKLHNSNLVMYDRQTESWWHQYTGEAVVGELTGSSLTILPSQLQSLEKFSAKAPDGRVLVPWMPWTREYGSNPYVGYDTSPFPFLFEGKIPKGVAPMMRVIAIKNLAIALPFLRNRESMEVDGYQLSWRSGQNSALDNERIDQGRDVGNIVVTRNNANVPYIVTFAFAFFAFNRDGTLLTESGKLRWQGSEE